MDINSHLLPAGTCPALFTKTLALNTEFRRASGSGPEDYDLSTTAIFTCTQTMRPWGPDESDAHPRSCRLGRSCYCGIEV